MGNTKKKEKEPAVGIRAILAKAVDLESLVRGNTELFDFSSLDVRDKLELLKLDPGFYADMIDVSAFKPDEKVYVLLNSKKAIADKVILSEDELKKVPDNLYGELIKVKAYFAKYARADRYPKMLKADQQEVFLAEPEWVMASVDKPPKLTSERLRELARRKPAFIQSYISDFSGMSTTADFWKAMIKFNESYKEIFLKNTKALITKTDVRNVVWHYPELIKKLDGDVLADSKLTCKEWLLFANTIIEANKNNIFDDWQFPEEVVEIFKLDLTAEMLNGKSTMSVRFQNAMKGVFKVKDKEENEDTPIS